jgi:hypothetical protein
MSNIKDLGAARRARTAKSYDDIFKKFEPLLPELVKGGDEVARYFNLFVQRGLIVGGARLRGLCSFNWLIPEHATAFERFEISCKVKDAKGHFFIVELVYKPGYVVDEAQAKVATKAFAQRVHDRLDGVEDRWASVTGFIMADILLDIMTAVRERRLVSLEEDNGCHLLFRDKQNPDLYLKIYLGGCFAHDRV